MTTKQRVQHLLQELNNGVYEKEEIMALSLLSAVAGESIFMLGAPGVAKSLIARRLKYAFKDGKSFEYLMSRFSTPDEIFGPVAISKLKNEDKYERVTENYLPNADVVFLDEIWKAGPSIQNALLTVINEKVYRNGAQEIKVPMKALISASNELPAKNEGLEALWDRFLVRLIVEGIQKKENFNAMISEKLDSYSDTIPADLKITHEDFAEWSKAIDEIEVPENVFNVIDVIRKKIQLHNDKNKDNQIYISDRRWRKIVRLLRTSAFLNDRKAVDLMDCFLIKDCLWNEEMQIEIVRQIVSDAIEQHGYKGNFDFGYISEELQKIQLEITEKVKFETNTRREILDIFYDEDTETEYYIVGYPYPRFIETDIDSHTFESFLRIFGSGNSVDKSLINKKDFESLTNTLQEVIFHSWICLPVTANNEIKVPTHCGTNIREKLIENTKEKYITDISAQKHKFVFIDQKGEKSHEKKFTDICPIYTRQPCKVRKGNTDFSFIITSKSGWDSTDEEIKLKTKIIGEKNRGIRKPSQEQKAEWDSKIDALLETTENFKRQIENYRNSDLRGLRTNLFVHAQKADIVEDNLLKLLAKVEQVKIDIMQVQHQYESAENKVVSFDLQDIDFEWQEEVYYDEDDDKWLNELEILEKHKIYTSEDFLQKDESYFDFLDEDRYLELKKAIQSKMQHS